MSRRNIFLVLAFSSVFLWYSLFVIIYSPELALEIKRSLVLMQQYSILRILMGIAFLFLILILAKSLVPKSILIYLLTFGFFIRIILLLSSPVIENDFYRYMWDGAVTHEGINPYKYSPNYNSINNIKNEGDKTLLLGLTGEAGENFAKINHPHLRSIYPPVSQIFFALADIIDSFNFNSLRIVFILFDLISVFLFVLILRKLNLPLWLLFIYWLNPIVIHEFFNAVHMDILIVPFLLLFTYFLISNKKTWSSFYLTLAIGIKFFPLVFFSVIIRKYWNQKNKLVFIIFLCVMLLAVIFYPVYSTRLDETSGLIKYAGHWTNNEAIFKIFHAVIKFVDDSIIAFTDCTLCITRWFTVAVFIFLLLLILRKEITSNIDLVERILLIISFLFFLSPTQFPWYFSWVIIWLVFRPRLSLLIYPILLPLYQMKYLSDAVVYIQHIPVFILFIWELRGGKGFVEKLFYQPCD